MRMYGNAVTIAAVFGLATACSFAGDWPQWRGPNRDGKVSGFTPPQTWPKELKQQWKATVGEGDSTPAAVGDKIFVFSKQGDDEVITCLNAADGKPLWQDKYSQNVVDWTGDRGHMGPRSSPAVASGKVVTLGAGGMLSCLDANSGKVLWRKDSRKDFSLSYPTFHVACSPLVVDDMCIVQLGGQGKGGVFAFDMSSGDIKWKWDAEAPSYASAVLMTVDATKMIVAVTESSVVGLDAASGKLLWQTAVGSPAGRAGGPGGASRGPGGDRAPGDARGAGGPGGRGPGGRGRGMGGGMAAMNTATPIVDGQTVIIAINGHKALKIEKNGGSFAASQLWSNPDVSDVFHTPIVHNGLIFGISNRGNLYCLDEKSGTLKWTGKESLGRGFGSIVDAGSVLIALAPAGELRVINPSDKEYSEVAKIKVADTETYAHPVLANNRLLIKDKESVISYDLQ